jgi:ABC-type lipoprotein release transport system permease subunit
MRWLVASLLCGVMLGITGARAAGDAVPGMLVSRQLLEREQLRVGQVVELSVDAAGKSVKRFRIDGVYEPLPDPMRFAQPRLEARLHLPDLQALAATRADAPAASMTSVNVRLADPSAAPSFAAEVTRRLPGLTARATSAPDERASTFAVLDRFHLAIAIVTIVGSGAFLLALMVMLVDERRETMTTLRLIGFTRGRLLTQVLVEGALIASAGVVFGVTFAVVSEPAFNRFFQWRYETALIFLHVTPAIVARSALIALPVGMLASAAAGWTFLRHRTLTRIGR